MARTEFEFQGTGRDGDFIVVDGQLPNLRTESFPAYVQTLPKAPRLKQGERAVLTYEGKNVYWRIRQPGVSRGESAGISIITVIVVVIAYDRIKKWLEDA